MKIIYIAPLSSIGGHSLISNILLEKLSSKYKIIPIDLALSSNHYGKFSIKRLIKVIAILTKIFFLKKNSQRVYLTISQSFFGNLKDILIYILLFDKLDKVIIHLHGGSLGTNLFKKNRLLKNINFFFYSRLKKIIISGRSHYQIFPRFLNKKIKVIRNFAPNYVFTNYQIIDKKFNNYKNIRILFLSNMLPEKGYLELFKGFKLLNKKFKNSTILEFAGKFYNPNFEKEFINLVEKEKNIFYHGEVSDTKKKHLLRNAHIFCLPTSFLEGQPISILEAYASGCFVITTKRPGIKDIFKNGKNGFFLNRVDSLSIKRKLEKILKNQKLCKNLAFSNRKYAGKYFKEAQFIKNIEKTFI